MSFAPPVVSAWRFDHVGVVVKSLAAGRIAFEALLDVTQWTDPLEDRVNGVHILFGRDPTGLVHELLAPIDEHSPVYRTLKTRTNLLNHTAYLVPSLHDGAAHMRAARCAPTSDPKPAIAYGGAQIQFFVTPLGTIIELIEAPDHQHHFMKPIVIENSQ
ncbi:MAG: glyoxalase family protein [Bradyrhizobium sp.]|nr:glyoxalase family protein [Bradyrhizobium sp.]